MIHVIRRHASVGVLPLLLSEIALLAACFYVSAEILYPPSGFYYLFLDGGVTLAAIAIATIILAMYFFDMYAQVHVSSRVLLAQQLCQAIGVAIIAQTVAAYVFRDWIVPHMMMLYSSVLALVVLFCWRLVFSALLQRVGVHDKLLFVGRNETSDLVARAVDANPAAGFRVIGFLDDRDSRGSVLGRVDTLRAMVAEHKPDLVVVGLAERRSVMPVADLVALRFGGLRIEEASKTFETIYQRVRLSDLSEQQAMFSRSFVPSPAVLRVERMTSFTLAMVCGIVFLPLLICIYLWMRFTSREPVFIKLPREGKDGRPFHLLRFNRSSSLRSLFDRFRLDALPELINVMRGEMSLVGPYPETPEVIRQQTELLPFYHYRTAVPPGMTGWAQINVNPKERENRALALEYDLFYIKHMSFALNMYILAHSLKNRILRP